MFTVCVFRSYLDLFRRKLFWPGEINRYGKFIAVVFEVEIILYAAFIDVSWLRGRCEDWVKKSVYGRWDPPKRKTKRLVLSFISWYKWQQLFIKLCYCGLHLACWSLKLPFIKTILPEWHKRFRWLTFLSVHHSLGWRGQEFSITTCFTQLLNVNENQFTLIMFGSAPCWFLWDWSSLAQQKVTLGPLEKRYDR